jgi:hypothetical protein
MEFKGLGESSSSGLELAIATGPAAGGIDLNSLFESSNKLANKSFDLYMHTASQAYSLLSVHLTQTDICLYCHFVLGSAVADRLS